MTGASSLTDNRPAEVLRGWSLAILMSIALLLGGGGSPSPVSELVLQLASAAILLAAFMAGAFSAAGRGPGRAACALAAMALALPVLHLIPLPPPVWQSLAGRDPVIDALALTGNANVWHPLSIAPERTLASLLATIPVAGILVLAAASSKAAIRRALRAILVLAILAAVLGAVQVGSDGQAGHFYQNTHRGWVTGFFANRNAGADHFLTGMIVLASLATAGRARLPAIVLFPVLLLLTVALAMTGSRTGIALFLAAALVVAAGFALRRSGDLRVFWVAGAVVPIAITAVFGWLQGGLRDVLARFGASGDMRSQIWPDAVHAAGQFWPAGAGMGTFREAFGPSQSLETLGTAAVNRAHNDYLELAIEGGLPAIVLVLSAAVLLVRGTWRHWKGNLYGREIVGTASAIIAVLGLHSLVDYPLRTMALACVFALAAGILAKPARTS